MSATPALAQRLDAALPQTQCTRCGYPDCRAYAQAMAQGEASTNQCPPGGQQGVSRLSALTGAAPLSLNPVHGTEMPRALALIDETACIGCALCLKACPVDAILGGPKSMHTVIADECTGCELCIPVCPVDCIALVPVTPGRTGWDAWSPEQAERARGRYAQRRARLERDALEQGRRLAGAAPDGAATSHDAHPDTADASHRKASVIDAARARARAQRSR